MNQDNKKKVSVELSRRDGETYFKFKIDKRIEEMYKKQMSQEGSEIKTSKSWPGLKFYCLPALTENNVYQTKLHEYRLFDNYGSGLYANQRLNIAWLRTVGGEGEIKLTEELSFAEVSVLVKKALQFIKEYFEDYYQGFVIKGSVSIEL